MRMDKENIQHEDQYDYNAYAALILLLNGFWRMGLTDKQREAVARLPEKGHVSVVVGTELLRQIGFDEDVVQMHDILDGICEEWGDDEDAILPFELHDTAEGQLRLDMAKEDFLTIILLDGFDMQVKH